MLFSSIPFICYFLTATLILYLIVPKQLKNSVLLVSSLFFYGWGEPRFVIIMVISILTAYIFGIIIEKSSKKLTSLLFCLLSVVLSLSGLIYFKYANFFIENFNTATGLSLPLLKIILPIGISFYTFQIISYTVDVYRKTVPAQKNPITLAAYVSLFPQLIAGPIVRYSDVADQLKNRTHTFELTAEGIRRFILGLSKKILIANALGELCDIFLTSADKSVLFYWLYAIAFMLHIYFDFSGYSDMAIGLGKIFGFRFMENFNYPYISRSITEFWRRWHISLGTWFRDYVYIPMGGNRVSTPKWLFNIFVVWFLTGFWHGAAWNFIIWGLYFAVLLIIEKLFLSKLLEKSVILSHIYVLFLVCISFVVFNASDMRDILSVIGGMFGNGTSIISNEAIYYFKSYSVIFVIAIIGSTPYPKRAVETLKGNCTCNLIINIAEPIVLAALFIIIIAYLVDGSFNPFLYFRF